MNSENVKSPKGEERRKAKRTAIQESFSFFLVIPNRLGMSKIYLRDVSATGLAFFSESLEGFSAGMEFEVRLYTGPAFFLPVKVSVVRVNPSDVAVSFLEPASAPVRAIAKFLEFIDLATEAAKSDASAKLA